MNFLIRVLESSFSQTERYNINSQTIKQTNKQTKDVKNIG